MKVVASATDVEGIIFCFQLSLVHTITINLGPVHTAPFLYKENLRFCESVHTDLHKSATKTEVFKIAIKSGYPQK